jgi:dipeptidyl aminopeptidase/acylaminoacyl peptidase
MKRFIIGLLLSLGVVSLSAESPDIVPGENLVAQGIPRIPAALADAVRPYTEVRSASFASWHPLRREMLVLTRFAETNQVHWVRMPGGDRRQVTFFSDRVSAAAFGPTREDSFVFSKDVGGGEFFQLYRYDVSTGAVTLLTDGKSRNLIGPWSRKGDRIAYTSTRRTGADTDVYVMDPEKPKSDRCLAEMHGGGWVPTDWSPDDSQIAVLEEVSVSQSDIWLLDVATGQKRRVTSSANAGKIAYGDARFSSDGRSLYTTTNKGSEFQRLIRIDLATGAEAPVMEETAWDVENFDLSRDGRRLAVVTDEDGASVLRIVDVAARKSARVSLPLGTIGSLRWHKNSRDLAFTFSGAQSPSDVYGYDAETGKLERWTESETGGLNAAAFAQPELVRWKSFDGRTISGFLYLPPARDTGPRPVVISIHGGPEGQARPGFLARWNYYLNELGVALIFPNVRGSTGFGKTFVDLDNGYGREDSVKDIGALIDWVKTRRELDAGRIMVTGGSYGGFMTLASAVAYNDRIRCALDVVGISNFVTFLQSTESYRRDLRRVEYGDERDPKMRVFLEKISPLTNAGKITKPLFVVAGGNDPRVPATESEQIAATVRKNGSPVWYLMAKDEGHGFAKKRNQDFQFYTTIAFIQENLLK